MKSEVSLMLFGWIIGIIAIAALVAVLVSDFWAGKHSSYFQAVQKPKGKVASMPQIPDASKHDKFFHKLNSR